jgi:hypothetical protein
VAPYVTAKSLVLIKDILEHAKQLKIDNKDDETVIDRNLNN